MLPSRLLNRLHHRRLEYGAAVLPWPELGEGSVALGLGEGSEPALCLLVVLGSLDQRLRHVADQLVPSPDLVTQALDLSVRLGQCPEVRARLRRRLIPLDGLNIAV